MLGLQEVQLLTEQEFNDDEFSDISPEDLAVHFGYKIKPTDTHFEIIKKMKEYIEHNEKFMKKGFMDPGIRARAPLLELFHLVRKRRKEISTEVYSLKRHYHMLNHPELYKDKKDAT
jgi:hypothetical protein